MHKEIKKFIPIADFLSYILGKDTEILIHDLTNFQESIIYILNGHISNRKIGDPITNLILEFLQNESRGNKQFICNYNSKTSTNKLLHSSTFFIRDHKNKVVGALCLNSDHSEINNAFNIINSFLPNFVDNNKDEVKENLNNNSQQLTLEKIDSVINNIGISAKRMTIDEKTTIIKELQDYGIFMLKGAVQEVSLKLDMSEPSVYRYIKKINL